MAIGGIGLDEPVVWTSTDGVAWDLVELSDIEDDSRLLHVEQGGLGWMIISDRRSRSRAQGWFSTDGVCFRPVPDRVVGSNAAINDESVISIGRSPDPEIWVGTFDGLWPDFGLCGLR